MIGQRMDSRIAGLLARRLTEARLALFWEQFWPLLWPVWGTVGAFVALSLLNFWALLPGVPHAALLALFAVLLALSLGRVWRRLRLPSHGAARRRLERVSGIPHRPLTTVEDKLATGLRDPAAQAAWRLHQKRMADALRSLRVNLPRPGLLRHDPLGLRLVLAIMLFVGVMAAGDDGWRRLGIAMTPDFRAAAAAPVTLEAWINPPAYTGLAPVFLTRSKAAELAAEPAGRLDVPVGSTLLARLHGGSGAPVALLGDVAHPFEAIDQHNHQIELVINAGDRLVVSVGEHEIAAWPLNVLPDSPPTIAFAEAPQASARAALRLAYDATDDYGLAGVKAVLRRGDGAGEPFELDLPLPGLRLRHARDATYRDLTPHPWAGLPVMLVLQATDDLGQLGQSELVEFVLPERQFSHPVARALIEQRKILTLDPAARVKVARALDAISEAPESFHDDLVAYLAMRSAYSRLLQNQSPEAVGEVVDMLWEIALRIEDGVLSLAERKLRDAQQALMDALAGDATDAEIERLMDELQAAMEEFLAALAEQARERAMRGEEDQLFDPDSQLLDSQSLREMLDRAREMSRAGAREAARNLLAQLQNMLENLKAGRMAQMPGRRAGERMLNRLSELMRQQQELLDKTFREAQRGQGNQPGQMSRPGRPGQFGPPGALPRQGQFGDQLFGPNGLGARQEALRRQLGELMRRLGEGFGDIPRPLGRAERSMRSAREALEFGEPGAAVGPQSDAMDQMRQGAEAMMQEMIQRFGQAGRDGEAPFGRTSGDDEDPLGRPLGAQWDYGESVKIPDKMDLQRAREILEELYRRSGERARPRLELDYIDRLLKRF